MSYEIDTEIIDMLYKAAYDAEKTGDEFRRPITPFSKTQPIGVNKLAQLVW